MSDAAKTPLYPEHVRLGGRIVDFAGWLLPIQYSGLTKEHEAVRERAGLFDASHMGELELRGPAALAVADRLITNDLSRAGDGQALYTCCCNEQGTILDDLIVYRFARDRVMIVCNASNHGKISAHVAAAAAGHCEFEDRSPVTALLALQGPRALDVLEAAGCDVDVRAHLASFRFAESRVAGTPALVARTGYTGEDGVELFVAGTEAAALWRALLEAGSSRGLVPAGLGARNTLRLEARLSLYGHEIDETTNPLEAGLGWTVKLDKPAFVGKAALEEARRRGFTRRLVGFEMTGRGIARDGYPLLDLAGAVVGVCTSGGPGPTVGKNIGLGYLPVGLAEVGTEFQVDCRGKAVAAVVVKTPFYKRAPRAE